MLHKHKPPPLYIVCNHKTLSILKYFRQLSEFSKKISETQTIPTHYFMLHLLLWKQFVNPRSLVMTSESLFQFCAYWIPIKPSVSANLTQNMTTWKPLIQHSRKYEHDMEWVKKMYLWCTRCIRTFRSWWNLSIIIIFVSNI